MLNPTRSASSFAPAATKPSLSSSPSFQNRTSSGAPRHIQVRHCNALSKSLSQARVCPGGVSEDLLPRAQLQAAPVNSTMQRAASSPSVLPQAPKVSGADPGSGSDIYANVSQDLFQAVYKGSANEVSTILLLCDPSCWDLNKPEFEKYSKGFSHVLNRADRDGKTALIDAVRRGNEAIVTVLLDNAADIEISDAFGKNALYHAVKYGRLTMVKLLHESAGDASFSKCLNAEAANGLTPLMRAVADSDEEITRFLLTHANNVKFVSSWGLSIFAFAAANGNENIMRALLEKRGEPDLATAINQVDSKRVSPLMGAVMNGNEAVAMLLLSQNARVDLSDNWGRTALHHAILRGRQSLVDALIRQLADSVAPSLSLDEGCRKIKEYVNKADAHGETPLMWAARAGDLKTVEFLLAHGADPTLMDHCKAGALEYAIAYEKDDAAAMLAYALKAYEVSSECSHNAARQQGDMFTHPNEARPRSLTW